MQNSTRSDPVTTMMVTLSLENPAFCIYVIVAALLVLKMMAVSLMTAFARTRSKAFLNPEDAKFFSGEVKYDDEAVRRTTRVHRNDLENIPIFLVASLVYLFTNPPVWLVATLYVLYLVARIVHTIVYGVFVVPQPSRAIAWATGFLITGYLAAHSAVQAFIHVL